jgi:hypothetical protein
MHVNCFLNFAIYLLINNYLCFIPIICSFLNPPQYIEYIKNIGKINLQSILNKYSPRDHIELEIDVLSVPGKLVKYVVY